MTNRAEETGAIVQEALHRGIKYFVAVGGDGTVNALASQLVFTDAALGIIPRGSGNGLARHMHMPKDIHRSIQRLVKKRSQKIDAIQINNQWSFNVAGIGFDGHISTIFGRHNGDRYMPHRTERLHQILDPLLCGHVLFERLVPFVNHEHARLVELTDLFHELLVDSGNRFSRIKKHQH